MQQTTEQENKLWLNTRELITITLLASLGGTLSSFVSYLGLQLNLIVGTSQGAGQILSGAHTFWLVLIGVLTPQFGSIVFSGALKGFVELFTGSAHGFLAVIYSISQGVVVEITMWTFAKFGQKRHSIVTLSVAAGLSNMSIILISQILFYTQLPLLFLLIMFVTAFISGIIFGGYLTYDIIALIKETDLWEFQDHLIEKPWKIQIPPQIKTITSKIANAICSIIQFTSSILGPFSKIFSTENKYRRALSFSLLVLFILIGSLFALASIQAQFSPPYSCNITGQVQQPYTFRYEDFKQYEVTIEAKLDGAYTHLPPANYTGIPLRQIILTATPKETTTVVTVIASDKYEATFNLSSVINDDRMILSKDTSNQWLWLIAGDYAGGYWVRMVSTIKIS